MHAQNKGFNEANTVKIVQDICVDLLGYHKYYDIDMEYSISGKRCDMAILIDKKLKCLIEVKALRKLNINQYTEQAVKYGINSRTHCVVLTNARIWYVFWLNHENLYTVRCERLFVFDILNDRASKIAKCFQYLAKEHITQFIEDGIAKNKTNINVDKKLWSYRFINILTYVGLAVVDSMWRSLPTGSKRNIFDSSRSIPNDQSFKVKKLEHKVSRLIFALIFSKAKRYRKKRKKHNKN
ncbi:MAG: hypothetical protein OXC44_05015 [Proteobacteria bacterium]|nr:hypothetical protein [Pseudomonadota bacterium]